ncbi:TPA: DUF285 domain-containing protein [Campylobacter coli]|nr:DUF285 domain-containing protein [Campylobacter coli]
MAQDLDTQLLDAIEALRKAPLSEWDAKKSAILELFSKGAKIPPHIIENLETYLSDLEQEYWDDRAVYAGRSVKDSDEYELFNILSKLNNAKDKKKSLNALFKATKSTGVIHTPKNKAELKKLIKDKKIYLGDIDISKIKSFKDLFKNSRRRDFSGIETWDTSKVTDMQSCFEDAEHFNHNIESWNVSCVESMESMFKGAEAFNQPLDKWDISNVGNFEKMFAYATNFNQSLDKWDISNVGNFEKMFAYATNFNQNLESWGEKIDFEKSYLKGIFWSSGIEKNNNYPSWYRSCNEEGIYQPKCKEFLKELLTDNISPSKIDTSLIIDMSELFVFASFKETQWFDGIESWDVSSVKYMYNMFAGCKNFNSDISNWNVSSVVNMSGMFENCINFRQDLSKWSVSSKVLLESTNIFKNCPTNMLEIWDKKHLDFLNAKNTNATNKNAKYFPKTTDDLKMLCEKEELYLGDIDTSLITDMSRIFHNSQRKDFSGIELWDTSNVVCMKLMFFGAKHFNHNIESWDVSKVENMESMFEGAKAFNQPLDKWNLSSLQELKEMFRDCCNFNQNLDSWEFSKEGIKNAIENKNNIFHGTKLENNFPKWLQATQKIPESVKEICDLLKEMCDDEYEKGKAFFKSYYDRALQGLKTLLEKKKVNDKDLARIYALAMGEREFYKENTIGNCPLELLELIKKSATDPKIALKIGQKDKQRMSFLDNAASVGRADIVKILFDCGEVIEGMNGLKGLYYHRRQISQESMIEILRLYKANGLKDTDLDFQYGSLYILALEHGIFSKEEIEKELGEPLLECVLKEYMPEGSQYIEWYEYFASKDLSQEEKDFIVQDIKERKSSRKVEDYLQRYNAILEKLGAKGIL